MNKNILFVVAAFVAGAAIAVVSIANKPQLAGDFAGGIVPSQLFTASAATNSVTPITANLLVNGAVSVGGSAAANQIPVIFTATTSFPLTSTILGPVTAATSTTSTSFGFTSPGFSVGDSCNVSFNGVGTSSSQFGADAFVTNVSGNSVTTTATLWNGSSSALTIPVTSTITGVSSTLKVTCFHTGV